MGTYVQQVPVKFQSYTITVGTPTYVDTRGFPFPINVTAIPQGGGSISVLYSTTPAAAGNPGAATWFAWPGGTVSTTTNGSCMAPIAALQFTATTANGVVEVCA